MAERKNTRKRRKHKEKIKKTAAFFTLTTTTTSGKEVSSIILPSHYTGCNSFSSCEVCPITGTVVLEAGTHFLKAATVREHTSRAWRDAARHNHKKISEMSHNPGVRFAVQDEIQNWVNQVDTKFIRFFTGGDVHCQGILESILDVAERTPNKRFWQPSADVGLLNSYWETHFVDDVPGNMMLYMEAPYSDNLYWAGYPVMTHSYSDGVDELDHWPDGKDFHVRISEESQTIYNQAETNE